LKPGEGADDLTALDQAVLSRRPLDEGLPCQTSLRKSPTRKAGQDVEGEAGREEDEEDQARGQDLEHPANRPLNS
jgi:hypothetical protein